MNLIYMCEFKDNARFPTNNGRNPIAFDSPTKALEFWISEYGACGIVRTRGCLLGPGTSRSVMVSGTVVGTITAVEFRCLPDF